MNRELAAKNLIVGAMRDGKIHDARSILGVKP